MMATAGKSARRTVWTHIALVAMCVLGMAISGNVTAYAADSHVAGLIIDYGDGRISYAWVPFSEDEISGIELLERSGLDLVTVGFGGMGDAVCQIDDTGCPVGDCRQRLCQTSDPESPFWRYSRQTAPGEWSFVATGVSGSKVHDGDIDAWSWTGTEAELPAMTMDQLADLAGADASILEGTSGVPGVALQTRGEGRHEESESANSIRNVIVGTGVVLAIAGFAGFAVWRSRRALRSTP